MVTTKGGKTGGGSNAPPDATAKLKRKQHPGKEPENNLSNARQRKRAKTLDAREIATQTSDKALKSGKLDVNAFVQAREFEIRALEEGMARSKKGSTRRAFQQVPRDMRRRTASHNVKLVPKRLRPRAEKEMVEDNTPTVVARRRVPSSHMRLRLETAKRLHGLAKRAKARKKSLKDAKGSSEEHREAKPRPAKAKRTPPDALANPPKPAAKFRKRQVNKTWLPTHIFHAKRAHMTLPKSPLWRFAIPITPTEKSYRPTHRATGLRGAVVWDMSYMSTIGLEGVEATLEGLLKALGVGVQEIADGLNANVKMREKWKAGRRSWEGWLFARGEWPTKPIAPALIVWCAPGEALGDVEMLDVETVDAMKKPEKVRPLRRKVFIRIHPSAFLQLWNEIVAVAKMQRPLVTVEDLRFDIGSIEIKGPGSTEALLGALKPIGIQRGDTASPQSPGQVWSSLAPHVNPASLPENALLGFDVSDPRLHYPPRAISQPSAASQPQAEEDLLNILSTWPPDHTQSPPALFTRLRRLEASRLLASQKSINRRKGMAMPGAYPDPLPSDPRIPILLLASRRPSASTQGSGGGQGKWTLLLPWKCVLPMWYSLVHYPLSSGGNPRFGGLREIRQAAFETGTPWFPGDYPGTRAGWEWEEQERERRRGEWERRPKGKRTEWGSIPLSKEMKGEIGIGWGCDWERVLKPASTESQPPTEDQPKLPLHLAGSTSAAPKNPAAPASPSPPLDIWHLPTPLASLALRNPTRLPPSLAALPKEALATAFFTAKITLLTRGRPQDCARIYRLPTSDPELRRNWLSLLPQDPARKSNSNNNNKHLGAAGGREAHHRPHPLQALASSLLAGPPARRSGDLDVPQAGDADYPVVPGEGDLIGFVTSGNFSLGEGRGIGVGCLAFGKVGGGGEGKRLCIVREAGGGVGRLGRWEVS
ncbi:hypothetical protein FGG08_005300 [Glutinoglossum americanum]|uniref:POPLD-domain-containing protein n=1 Tax=Glutinoglossum americanum TaxID=1670608 RepID=A0A9P8I5Q7_9PEZI|nr:hypothetical protein FGG08_005300 [Glutinoglossum americanum]